MKTLLCTAVALAALALAPSALATPVLVNEVRTTPATALAPAAKTPQVLLRDLRACSKGAYDPSAYRCMRDERSRPVVSPAALCTITVYAYSAVTVRATMRFAGGAQYSATRKVKKRTRFQFAFGIELPQNLPAGSYTCQFSAGKKRASATLRSGGPGGPVAYASVCATVLLRGDQTGCTTDQAATPLPGAMSLSCSAWIVGQQGKRVTGELLYNDNGVWTRLEGGELTLPRPIVPVWLTMPSLLGAPYLSGQYACRFSVDGQLIGEKLFTVA